MQRALFLALPLALSSVACTYDNGDARRIPNEPPTGGAGATGGDCGPSTPIQTSIDTNAEVETQIDVLPGESAGVFVNYAAGGHWSLRTTCDTLKNNAPCAWDIVLTPEDGRSITNVKGEDLEAGSDSVRIYPDYPRSYQFLAQTSADMDGITFDTEPQTAIQVDVFLDDACALPYFFWIGDGAAHTGAPSNPLVLIPTPE